MALWCFINFACWSLTAWSSQLSTRALLPMSLERRLDSLPYFALAIALIGHCLQRYMASSLLILFLPPCPSWLLILLSHPPEHMKSDWSIHRVHKLICFMALWRWFNFACSIPNCLVLTTVCSRLTTHEPRKAIGFPALFALAIGFIR